MAAFENLACIMESEHDSEASDDPKVVETVPAKSKEVIKRSSRKRSSKTVESYASKHFEEVYKSVKKKNFDGSQTSTQVVTGLKCKKCTKVLSVKNSVDTLKYHVENVHSVAVSAKSLESYGFNVATRKKSFKEYLVNFVINGTHPFTVVEEPWFKEMVAFLNPEFSRSLPVASTLKLWTEEHYNKLLGLVIRHLRGVSTGVSLTTDMWTALSGKPYLVVTGHFLQGEAIRSLILDFHYAPQPHTSECIRDMVLNIIAEFDLTDKIVSITTDNGSNNNGLSSLTGALKDVKRVRCVAHSLHLSVSTGLELVKEPLKRLREVMNFIKNSPKQDDQLQKLCNAFDVNYVRPLGDSQTRWNSTFDMIKRALLLEEPIKNLIIMAKEFETYSLTDEDWLIFRGLKGLLEPYEKGTKLLSGSKYSTLSLVYPVFTIIVQHLEAHICKDLPKPLQDVPAAMRNKLDDYRSKLITDTARMATALDPRFKLDVFPVASRPKVRRLVERAFASEKEKQPAIIAEPSDVCETGSAALIKSLLNKTRKEDDEVTSYFSSPVESSDPIQFWTKMPSSSLKTVALRAAIMNGSSVPSEQAFSKAGDMITKKRNRLGSKMAKITMCLKSWTNFIDYLEIETIREQLQSQEPSETANM